MTETKLLRQTVLEAVSLGWCHPNTSTREMDVDLAQAITDEVMVVLYNPKYAEPRLGLATTSELLEEIRSRIETDYYAGGGGLGYSTVKGRPGGATAIVLED